MSYVKYNWYLNNAEISCYNQIEFQELILHQITLLNFWIIIVNQLLKKTNTKLGKMTKLLKIRIFIKSDLKQYGNNTEY